MEKGKLLKKKGFMRLSGKKYKRGSTLQTDEVKLKRDC